MLINFSVSNFLSFNNKQDLSLLAKKTRRHKDRIYINRRLRLLKGQAVFGANGSGKSNLIKSIWFVRQVVINGFPNNFSNSYFRLDKNKRHSPTIFEVELLCDNKHLCFGFSSTLEFGSITEEWLYEITPSGLKKYLYERKITEESFIIGDYFKNKSSIEKLKNYGEDSISDHNTLFLTIINHNKTKMFSDNPELIILKNVFDWFALKLNISFPEDLLTGKLYFKDTNLQEIANILNNLGTGIKSVHIVNVPQEIIKNKIPTEIYNNILSELEKANAQYKKEGYTKVPSITARAYKEFYTFEISTDGQLSIKTIEFEHESNITRFSLDEESDGTAHLFNLIEILLHPSDDRIYIIDEIDRCLHPALTTQLVKLFMDKANSRNAQLIITTHESRLLKDDLLRSDEISFALKNVNGSTIIKSLDKYQLRADKNIYEALFDGTIDAVPHYNNL